MLYKLPYTSPILNWLAISILKNLHYQISKISPLTNQLMRTILRSPPDISKIWENPHKSHHWKQAKRKIPYSKRPPEIKRLPLGHPLWTQMDHQKINYSHPHDPIVISIHPCQMFYRRFQFKSKRLPFQRRTVMPMGQHCVQICAVQLHFLTCLSHFVRRTNLLTN